MMLMILLLLLIIIITLFGVLMALQLHLPRPDASQMIRSIQTEPVICLARTNIGH